MPGIIVIKQKNNTLFQRNRDIIHEMTKVIMHESFYKSQFMEVPELGLHACKVYLDHEYSPNEISKNEDGSIYCLLSGELYGINEINALLNKSEHTIRNKDDVAETIIHFYEDKGEKILRYLNGCFNLLIADVKKKKVFVSNDRFGLDRFYYCNLPDGSMLFAPEVKCFKFIPEVNLTLDVNSIIQNFRYNCILGNNSFYKEINKFPIATVFTHENDNWKMNEYWAPEEVLNKPKLSLNTYIEKGTEVFESIVEDYYTPNSTGLSLTGGYDTRSVLCVLDKKRINLPCYTFGGMYNDSFDVKSAKGLADLTGNSHHKIILGEDFLNNIDKWFQKAIYVSDGIAKLSFCHEYFVNLAAKEFGTVRLTGKYGSQVVRGVSLLKDRSPVPGIFAVDFRRKYSNNGNELNELKKWGLATLLREELPQLEATKQSQEDAVLTVRTPFMDNKFIDLLLRAPIMDDKSLLQENIIHKNAPHFSQIPTNHRAHLPRSISSFIKTGPLKNSARYFHSSMSLFDCVYNWEALPNWGLLPFKISENLRFSRVFNGTEMWVHYRLWFMKELKEYITNIILDPITLKRPWYNSAFLSQMIKDHFNGRKNFTSEINKIVSFEMWCRQNKI